MVLTLEDAYYDHHGTNMHGAHDPLGLAVAKMSYHVYSLGEGIVGQVAVSGEHQWVFPENYNNCNSAFEVRDFLSEIKFVFFVFLNQMSFFNYSFITFGKVKFLLELRPFL
jgi:hypothetical protein